VVDLAEERAHAGSTEPEVAPVRRLAPRPSELSDAEAVRRARDGDHWAQELLFRRYARLVSATATRLLGDRGLAEDILQDTFAVALERLDTLRNPAAFKSWLMRIAVSQVHRIYRRERFVRLLKRSDGPSPLARIAARSATPEMLVELELVDRELRRLPPEQRLAWMLRYCEGLELREVAEACGCSLATAKRRISAAHARVTRHVQLGDA